MASSSSSTSCDEKKRHQYDVFLSFSGEDTRRTFVDHLNDALQRHNIRTFKDDERLEKGKEIKEELLKSIEDSKFCIIIFSKKYASSSWCLDELVKIMECHKTTYQTAFPVFYDVEPTEVRKQSGSVGEAFAKHTKKKVVVRKNLTRNVGKALARHSNKKLGKWRKALKDAANLCGWELKNTAHGHEAKVIKLIVERISLELRSMNVGVDENLIGMEQRIQDLESFLDIDRNDVRIIGIKGMGGAGKTTLAQAIFSYISYEFEGKSFVENVRENSKAGGLKKLQEQVLTDLLKDKSVFVSSVHEGTHLMKTMLCGKKVLVVLDDVDHKDQLEALAGDLSWFKPGSRIIITTRDEQVLIAHKVKLIRDVDLLSDEEASLLFSRHAFQEDISTHEYEMQSIDQVVRYAAGLPLTIKVLGSFLCGKDKLEWIDALTRLKSIPLEETLKKLEVSYDSLEDDYKEIFLDVACFHRTKKKDRVLRALESCGFRARNGLRVLQLKSLITFDEWNTIHMHDHIVEMGNNIVRRKHPDDPQKHSRLWVPEEIKHVLANHDLCNENIRCIQLNDRDLFYKIDFKGLENLKKLRFLSVDKLYFSYVYPGQELDVSRQCFPTSLQYLERDHYPYSYLPKKFKADNLVGLEMSFSKIEHLFWEGGKVMKKLKFLDLSWSKLLRSLDLGLTPNLERLNLELCSNLEKLEVHGGCLKTLVYLNLKGCYSLKSSYLFMEQLESLEVLHLPRLESPDSIIKWPSKNTLLELYLLNDDNIEEIPAASIGNLHKLVSLDLSYCRNLKSLPPGSICSLQHLRTLNLHDTSIKMLHEDIGQLECLEYLYLSYTKLKRLPDSICMLKCLKILLLEGCFVLEKLPEDVGHLESLVILNLRHCYNLRDIPDSICKLKHLQELNLKYCERLEKLPDNMGDLKCLRLLTNEYTGIRRG